MSLSVHTTSSGRVLPVPSKFSAPPGGWVVMAGGARRIAPAPPGGWVVSGGGGPGPEVEVEAEAEAEVEAEAEAEAEV